MEQGQSKELPIEKSTLQINPVYFDEISFKRQGPATGSKETTTKLGIRKEIEKIADGQYRVIVGVRAEKAREYIAEVQISGYCNIDESIPSKDRILDENAVSILFAYIRTELTLITSQPGVEPIVLPVVNITEMLKKAANSEK